MSLPLKKAIDAAAVIFRHLEPACARLVVCGGVRRGSAQVHDFDFVCQPHMQANLLDEDLPILQPIFDRVRDIPGEWSKGGDRFVQVKDVLRTGASLDLFIVHPPAQWGSTVAIRTGPWQLSRYCVTKMRERGFQHAQGRVQSLKTGVTVPTPDEKTFFEIAGVPFVEPEERTALAARIGLL